MSLIFVIRQPISWTRVWGAAKLAVGAYKDAMPMLAEPVKEAADKILAHQGETTVALLTMLEEFANRVRSTRDKEGLTEIIIALLQYASKPAFKIECYHKENPGFAGERKSDE